MTLWFACNFRVLIENDCAMQSQFSLSARRRSLQGRLSQMFRSINISCQQRAATLNSVLCNLMVCLKTPDLEWPKPTKEKNTTTY